MMPVPRAGVLRAVRGVAEAEAAAQIESVEIEARVGDRLVPLPEGSDYPGFIFARAGDAGDGRGGAAGGVVADRV